jgi:hypothetical protein
VLPELARDLEAVDTVLLSPGFLVLCPTNLPVANPAERNCELVARLAADRGCTKQR